ncbi:hypothetical protein GCM10025867_50590 (plasmid) [Frondihabitans sucicola]|uniref:Uncharacterized protein n=1 Tax=Frondihabitans sucicola TaxID=1268041 RepID=A0ABN6Y9X7_9MICO|nr:hypothetical protein [Frondihabitans sucicola]BDZ52818.1 hypothetical protein GCM10025867_50590 [Frondihabitans sucicola]
MSTLAAVAPAFPSLDPIRFGEPTDSREWNVLLDCWRENTGHNDEDKVGDARAWLQAVLQTWDDRFTRLLGPISERVYGDLNNYHVGFEFQDLETAMAEYRFEQEGFHGRERSIVQAHLAAMVLHAANVLRRYIAIFGEFESEEHPSLRGMRLEDGGFAPGAVLCQKHLLDPSALAQCHEWAASRAARVVDGWVPVPSGVTVRCIACVGEDDARRGRGIE